MDDVALLIMCGWGNLMRDALSVKQGDQDFIDENSPGCASHSQAV